MITLDGRTLTSLGVSARSVSGWRDGPLSTRAFRALANSSGGLFASRAAGQLREIELTVNIPAVTIAGTTPVLDLLDEATQGLVALAFPDAPGRVVRVIRIGRTVVGAGADTEFLVPRLLATYTFAAADGASYDTEPMLYALSTTPVPIALGTLPSLGVVQITGAWTGARTLTYRGANGIAYGSLAITVPVSETLLGTEYVELDLARRTITRVGPTGARTDAYAWKSAGAWFACDPTDATRAFGQSPTLALSAGTGIFITRRAWSV